MTDCISGSLQLTHSFTGYYSLSPTDLLLLVRLTGRFLGVDVNIKYEPEVEN